MPLSDRSRNPDKKNNNNKKKKKKKKQYVTRYQKIINWILSDILCSFEYVLQTTGNTEPGNVRIWKAKHHFEHVKTSKINITLWFSAI